MNKELSAAIKNYVNWLSKDALPLWSSKGIDKDGSSIEQFNATGLPDLMCNKRVRVQARQMFVFSAADQQSWINNGFDLVSSLESFCQKYATIPGKSHYAHILNADNIVINPNTDLYDIAFFLLAYAWRYHVFNDLNALKKANSLLNAIDFNLKESPGGWMEGDYSSEHRRQNPHMHLFEAFLTLYQFTNDGKWLAKAGEIYCLFETTFFDHKNKVLLEFFSNDWKPAAGNIGTIVEPGHMMEWVWLLRQYQKFTQAPVDNYCHHLYHNALRLGLDTSSNLLFDEVNTSGDITKTSKRCWPMTEWIKASLAQAEHSNTNDTYDYISDAVTALSSLTEHYLTSPHQGQYIDSIGENNEVIIDNAPASTLYHLVVAGLEAQKFSQKFTMDSIKNYA
ncbi:AGE family epimerase/isomerase [Colwellia sp. E2M01]|uniref:AGE family epimerase/isomerase n=1 Tax=Colwellia sp. E2M01 TaxID=2841561 RepID=UPI001C0A5963|nr:AGE family epimerase/isomerase [Colwellia sp. E2M01]MBU2870422.1 AGE family epimerase/isomerase [Colwellia sp. E2M01]